MSRPTLQQANPQPEHIVGEGVFLTDANGRRYKTHGPKGSRNRGAPGVIFFGLHEDPEIYACATCEDCALVEHLSNYRRTKWWWKCTEREWGRTTTDIRASDPACKRFEPIDGSTDDERDKREGEDLHRFLAFELAKRLADRLVHPGYRKFTVRVHHPKAAE